MRGEYFPPVSNLVKHFHVYLLMTRVLQLDEIQFVSFYSSFMVTGFSLVQDMNELSHISSLKNFFSCLI